MKIFFYLVVAKLNDSELMSWNDVVKNMDGTNPPVVLSHMKEGCRHEGADEDREYVTLCRKGNADAFGVLVRRHQKKMLNIAYRMTGDYEDACDIVQEAFLSAYRTIKKFRGEAKFSTWLFGIVVNHARNRIRHTRNKMFHETLSLDDRPDGNRESVMEKSPSRDASAVDIMMRREVQEKVQACINRLDAEHREVLVLRDIQGFSYEEIALMLKIPGGTVKSRLSRARNALKEDLLKVLGVL